ncbi:MAG: LSM domain-containing protein [Methanobacteriota archaeon]
MPELEEILNSSLDRVVTVTLRNGKEYKGTLKSFDEYTNIVIADAEERIGEETKKYRLLIIKGGNINLITPQ